MFNHDHHRVKQLSLHCFYKYQTLNFYAIFQQGLTSTRTSSCGYHSDGTTQEMVPPNTALIVNNTAGSLRDTEFDKKHTQFQCCCGHGVRWFDELNKFRQSQWFDCHAHLHPSCTSIDSDRNLDREIGHKCT
jgi:hypothetical protein